MALREDGVRVSGYMTPVDSTDVYPTHLSTLGRGGYREVADTDARDAIPVERMALGMLVYVEDINVTYRLTQITPSVVWETQFRRRTVSKGFANNGSTLSKGEVDGTHVYVDSSGGATGLTLPALSAEDDGMECSIKRLGANAVTITGSIDGGASFTLNNDNDSFTIVYVHSLSGWNITARPGVGGGGSLWSDLGSYLQPTGGEGISIAGTWNGPHIIFGGYHFWMTSNGVLLTKSSAPTGETDGTPVGAQSFI